MRENSAYIGLDVHKDTIAVAVAMPGRYEPVYRGELAHRRGSLEEQRFERPVQQVVFQEYVDTAEQATARVAALEAQMHEALGSWSLAPVAAGLRALRGVDTITAMTVLAELGVCPGKSSRNDALYPAARLANRVANSSHDR